MQHASLVPVLGDPRCIGAATDPERRAVALDGDRIVGIGAFEPIGGGEARASIELADGASTGLVNFLVDELVSAAARHGITHLRFEFPLTEQRGVAERVASQRGGCSVRRDLLSVRASGGRPQCGSRPARVG